MVHHHPARLGRCSGAVASCPMKKPVAEWVIHSILLKYTGPRLPEPMICEAAKHLFSLPVIWRTAHEVRTRANMIKSA